MKLAWLTKLKTALSTKQKLILQVGVSFGILLWISWSLLFFTVRADIRTEMSYQAQASEQAATRLSDLIGQYDTGELSFSEFAEAFCVETELLKEMTTRLYALGDKYDTWLLRFFAADLAHKSGQHTVDWMLTLGDFMPTWQQNEHQLGEPPVESCRRPAWEHNQRIRQEIEEYRNRPTNDS